MSLHFVNRHRAPVSICILWYNTSCNPPWRKTGWWNVNPGGVATPLIGNLNNRYYYFYARASDGTYWGDPNRQIAVTTNAFNVCLDHIFEPNWIVPLKEIDTGPYTNFTVNLV